MCYLRDSDNISKATPSSRRKENNVKLVPLVVNSYKDSSNTKLPIISSNGLIQDATNKETEACQSGTVCAKIELFYSN